MSKLPYLLTYLPKRRKLAESKDDQSEDDSSSYSSESERHEDTTEDTEEVLASPHLPDTNVSAEPEANLLNRTELQENYVTVEKPTGSTTIIINNQLDSEGSGNAVSTDPSNHPAKPSCVVSDIAQGIHQSPVQPLKRFPTTLFGSENRSFNSFNHLRDSLLHFLALKIGLLIHCGTKNTSGWSIPLKKMQHFVTHVVCFPLLLLVELRKC